MSASACVAGIMYHSMFADLFVIKDGCACLALTDGIRPVFDIMLLPSESPGELCAFWEGVAPTQTWGIEVLNLSAPHALCAQVSHTVGLRSLAFQGPSVLAAILAGDVRPGLAGTGDFGCCMTNLAKRQTQPVCFWLRLEDGRGALRNGSGAQNFQHWSG